MNDTIKKITHNSIWLVLFTIILLYISSIYFISSPINSTAEGDLGRDLYNFYLVSKGKLPYIDFNWIYGPFAPVLYGLVFKLFGISYFNALCVWFIVYLTGVYLLYFTIKSFSNHFCGFIAGLLFIVYYGYTIQTFNHILGVVFIVLTIFFLTKYFKTEKIKFLYLMSISCFLLALVKLNMALAFSGPLFFCLLISNYLKKKDLKYTTGAILIFLCLTVLVYGLLISMTPADQISKCFPYSSNALMGPLDSRFNCFFSGDETTITFNIENNIWIAVFYLLTTFNLWYFILPLAAFLFAFFLYKKDGFNNTILLIIILAFCSLLTTHEFVAIGTVYSLKFWSLATIIIMLFVIIDYLIANYHSKKLFKPVLTTIVIIIFFIISVKLYNLNNYQTAKANYCPYDRMKVSFINTPWYMVMLRAIDYIEKNTDEKDKIISLPYNAFYNFVSKRDFPGRHAEFLFITQLTDKDQKDIINDIEENKVKIILYSIKKGRKCGGVGIFGVTHCQMLDKYIKDNYEVDSYFFIDDDKVKFVASVGFYKRKTPFKDN